MQTREHDDTSHEETVSALCAADDTDVSDPRDRESESELQRYDEEEIITKPWPPQN